MALRAWISLRIGKTSDDLKGRGDVLCLKLDDSPVGNREWKEFLIVDDWKDDAIEAELRALRDGGEPHPVIVHPYAERDGDGNIAIRSTKRVDIDALPDKNAVLDKTTDNPPKRSKDIEIVEVQK